MIGTARNGMNAKTLKRKQFFQKKTQARVLQFPPEAISSMVWREKQNMSKAPIWSKNFHPETTCNYLHICNRIANIRVPKISRKTLLMWVTGTCNLRTVSKEGMADVSKILDDFGITGITQVLSLWDVSHLDKMNIHKTCLEIHLDRCHSD